MLALIQTKQKDAPFSSSLLENRPPEGGYRAFQFYLKHFILFFSMHFMFNGADIKYNLWQQSQKLLRY